MAFPTYGTPSLSSIPVTSIPDQMIYGVNSTDQNHISKGDAPPSTEENWPLGLETNRYRRNQSSTNMSLNDMGIRKWEGKTRRSTEWNGLRRDPELWYPGGDCLVYLYGRGQSMRGPSFRIPLTALIDAKCQPLLETFMPKGSQILEINEVLGEYFSGASDDEYVKLYIPAPAKADRSEAFLYHTATRNFFAWVCQKSLVGQDLGIALVALLDSMSQFRSNDANNVYDIVAYIDGEGYADMRNTPDHALAIMHFAEHFHFKDMWIDAFAHSAGMSEKLHNSPGFESLSVQDRAFISRARLEMDLRLDTCGKMLSNFLTEDLFDIYLQLSPAAESHLEKFRAFLQKYYASKLGSYPPLASRSGTGAFAKSLFKQMRSEFQKLYDFLVDSNEITLDHANTNGEGLNVMHAVTAFNDRHQIEPLAHALPLLPFARPSLTKRLTFTGKKSPKGDKPRPDPRLASMTTLDKATNHEQQQLTDCALVRAYRAFEKKCTAPISSKTTTMENISQAEGRKIRWILIYSTLQILIQATKVPHQVRVTQNVTYNICVRTEEYPPWNDRRSCYHTIRSFSPSAQVNQEYRDSLVKSNPSNIGQTSVDVIATFDGYLAEKGQPAVSRRKETTTISIKDVITEANARGSWKAMPELQHPSPRRSTHHEILIEGNGYGLEDHYTVYSTIPAIREQQTLHSKHSSSSMTSSNDVPSQWSDSSHDTDGTSFESSSTAGSRRTSDSFTTGNRRDSVSSTYSDADSLDQPFGFEKLKVFRPISTYSVSIYEEDMKAGEVFPSPAFSPSRRPGESLLSPAFSPSRRPGESLLSPAFSPSRRPGEILLSPFYSPYRPTEENLSSPPFHLSGQPGSPPRSILKPSPERLCILNEKASRHTSFGSVMVMNEELAAYLRV
ncbi:hypothetical protein DSL72_007778 [Monilinia vaccinii-corymbosi]|uniref:DUF8004 domain-containing protein n=1 Tax=Monilinia vaccinii-corymbosi TaxID=61207 RepID=A0A8A3PJ00_9HELO|nr:hypothetical protein DSL72_007778 [Monilinia vaccinii-corymbosi]